jgi:hypothetical protein
VTDRTSDDNDSRDWLAPAAVIGAALLVAVAFAAGYWAGSASSDEPTSEQRASAFL